MLAHEIRGSGPGLVLLPGIGGTATGTWGNLLADLATEYTVVLPDFPGSGLSPLPSGPLRADTVADQVVATARRAGLRSFVIGGTSLGATIAAKAAARHPDCVRGLFTLAGFARPRTTLWLSLEMWSALHSRADDKLSDFLASLTFSDDYLAANTLQTAREATARLVVATPGTARQIELALHTDIRTDLPTITVPTLVIAATGDRLVGPAHSLELVDGIPGARLAAVKGGHAATFEEPERTLEILKWFLRDLHRPPRTHDATPPHRNGAGADSRNPSPGPGLTPVIPAQRRPDEL
ncbi:alpha/beta fold hydrolase [Streptomyces sp. NPDC093516]|uniref:alpha/beta fold hydrolase n=1 Tax=Streptomyces sp. NPDC093516 TaxID=3155304 RepID=UPI0034473BF5